MRDTAQSIIDLVNNQGVFIGAGASLLFFLLEVFFDLGRTEKRSIWDNLKSAGLLFGAAGTMFYAFYSLYQNYEPVTHATRAERAIKAYYDRCLEGLTTLSAETRADIVSRRLQHVNPLNTDEVTQYLLQTDCLALALRRSPRGEDEHSQIAFLTQDITLGERLLRGDSDDETSIPATLYAMFGVDSSEFLGTGRSLPNVEDKTQSRYGDSRMREYWATNGCVVTTIKPEVCPHRMQHAWGWRFDSLSSVSELTLRQMLTDPERRVPPDEGGDTPEFQAFLRRLADPRGIEEPNPILVRFHVFPQNYYLGTIGRPEARQVFYSSLADSIDLPIREAFIRSGADDPFETRSDFPDNRAFVWIYIPETNDQYRQATWRNLFAYLRELRVDRRVRDAAEASELRWPGSEGQ